MLRAIRADTDILCAHAMLKRRPVQFNESLGHNTKAIVFAAQNGNFAHEIRCPVKRLDIIREIGERKRAAVLPHDTDTRIDCTDKLQTLFDGAGVQAEFQFDFGIFFIEKLCGMIDEACGCLGDQNVSDVFSVKLREGLKIDAVDRHIAKLLFKFMKNSV